MTYIDEFKRILPRNMLAVACDLKPIGSADLAWRYEDIKIVLAALKVRSRVILGGEIYSIGEEGIKLTWDAWDYRTDPGLPQEVNVERSYKAALSYIESYHKECGEDFCYSVIFR